MHLRWLIFFIATGFYKPLQGIAKKEPYPTLVCTFASNFFIPSILKKTE